MNKNFLALLAILSLVSSAPVFAVDWVNNATKKVQNVNDQAHQDVAKKVEVVENKMQAMLGQKDEPIEAVKDVADTAATQTEGSTEVIIAEVEAVTVPDEMVEVQHNEASMLSTGVVEEVLASQPMTSEVESINEVSAVAEVATEASGEIAAAANLEVTEESVANETTSMTDAVVEKAETAIDGTATKVKNLFKGM